MATDQDTENLAVVLSLIELGFNTGQFDLLDRVLAPDLVAHGPVPLEPGAEGFKRALSGIRDAFPDGHITIDDIGFGSDTVFRRWSFIGTHQGEFLGVPPANGPVSIAGVDIERLRGGLIVEHWSFWNALEMLDQLGASPGA